MLRLDLTVIDENGSHKIGRVEIVRGEQHPRNSRAYWYAYLAKIKDSDSTKTYMGEVMHSYDNGAVRLAQKVLKSIGRKKRAA